MASSAAFMVFGKSLVNRSSKVGGFSSCPAGAPAGFVSLCWTGLTITPVSHQEPHARIAPDKPITTYAGQPCQRGCRFITKSSTTGFCKIYADNITKTAIQTDL